MDFFEFLSREDLLKYTHTRFSLNDINVVDREDYSVNFAYKVDFCLGLEQLYDSNSSYVVIGIPEDIGVRANLGRAGTAAAWESFLAAFLNMQHSSNNDATRFCVLGNVITDDLMEVCEELDTSNHLDRIKLSDAVKELDNRVTHVVQHIIETGKIPIIVGGGHNNCYPIIRAFKSIDVINIDAHTDLRVSNGRHSGNGFSHALEKKYLNHYFMIGIQEDYLSQPMIDLLQRDNRLAYTAYQLDNTVSNDVEQAITHIDSSYYGLEIDMDVVIDFPSSAQSPVGITLAKLRKTVNRIIKNANNLPRYIHICEAAPQYGYTNQVGKALASIVNDMP